MPTLAILSAHNMSPQISYHPFLPDTRLLFNQGFPSICHTPVPEGVEQVCRASMSESSIEIKAKQR